MHLLLERHADVNSLNKQSESALHLVAKNGNVKIVEMLLDYHTNSRFYQNTKIDLNVQDWEGRTPLMRALVSDIGAEAETAIVKMLVSHDCDVNVVDDLGNTALIYALAGGREDLSIFLVLYGADIKVIERVMSHAIPCKNKQGQIPEGYPQSKLNGALVQISDIIEKTMEEEKKKETSQLEATNEDIID